MFMFASIHVNNCYTIMFNTKGLIEGIQYLNLEEKFTTKPLKS